MDISAANILLLYAMPCTQNSNVSIYVKYLELKITINVYLNIYIFSICIFEIHFQTAFHRACTKFAYLLKQYKRAYFLQQWVTNFWFLPSVTFLCIWLIRNEGEYLFNVRALWIPFSWMNWLFIPSAHFSTGLLVLFLLISRSFMYKEISLCDIKYSF